ncbi:hypothetical protein [Desertivirga xinjiangensis]|uniref:hypothetical protein n=1 Tax=Desertivirga xinjiangensis TaxID=539206 RepID=UPI002109A357|nr:hypothetical protein [Pedobacter xinjiangensis]
MTLKTDNTEAGAFRKCLIVIGILMLLVTIVLVSTLVNAANRSYSKPGPQPNPITHKTLNKK